MMTKEAILKNISNAKVYKSFQEAIKGISSELETLHFKTTAKLKKKAADERSKRRR